MWIGAPSVISLSPSAATEASDDRSTSSRVRPRVLAEDLVAGGLPLAPIPDRHDDLGARAGESGCDPESDTVAGTGDHGPLSGQIVDADVVLSKWHECCSCIGFRSWSCRHRVVPDSRFRDLARDNHGLRIRG